MPVVQDKPSPHDPGTSDDDVSPMRLVGRKAYRKQDESSEPVRGMDGRIDWWRGWYDEQLRRWFGR